MARGFPAVAAGYEPEARGGKVDWRPDAKLVAYGFLALPAVFIIVCLAGAVALPLWPGIGFATVLVACPCLFGAATPAVSSHLLQRLEAGVPSSPKLEDAQAIIVLAGDEHLGNGGEIPDKAGPLSVGRVFFRRGGLSPASFAGRRVRKISRRRSTAAIRDRLGASSPLINTESGSTARR